MCALLAPPVVLPSAHFTPGRPWKLTYGVSRAERPHLPHPPRPAAVRPARPRHPPRRHPPPQGLQDVPLRIVQDMEELYQYTEPLYAEHIASLSVVLPHGDIRGMRNVIERMKSFSDYVLLTARDVAVGARADGGGGGERTAMLQLQVRKKGASDSDDLCTPSALPRHAGPTAALPPNAATRRLSSGGAPSRQSQPTVAHLCLRWRRTIW